MREIGNTVRQALALLNPRLRRRWLLHVPWSVVSALLEMMATAAMLVLIRLISDPAGADRYAPLRALRQRSGFDSGLAFTAAFGILVALLYAVKNVLRLAETYAQQRCASATALWISSGLLERYLRARKAKIFMRHGSSI